MLMRLSAPAPLFISQRLASHARCYSVDKTDLFDVLEEETEKEVDFKQWLRGTRDALSASKGRFWLGKLTPFPYNPSFVPKRVLGDAAKTRIFELFRANAKTHDCRNLSQRFKISRERIKAIIRQKELELQLAQAGNVVDKAYVKQMESNLECGTEMDETPRRDVGQGQGLPLRPVFACVPEGRGFNFEDAKSVLLARGINIKAPGPQREAHAEETHHVPASTSAPTVFSQSEFERSKSKFVFVDVVRGGAAKEAAIIVRDRDGTLRTANTKEATMAVARTWNRNAPRLKQ